MRQSSEPSTPDRPRPAQPGIPPADSDDEANRLIGEALRDLQYGQVTVTVQDGVIVQVDRLERWRTGT
jgi:hypothetical protein